MNINSEIFRAYDIRGLVDESLTEEGVEAIGRAVGSMVIEAGRDQVVIGRDGRLSGPRLIRALARGLADTGCRVIDIGMVPTPVVYFATYHLGTGCGVAVTGSHNPPNYNGLKMVVDGVTLSGDAILSLLKRVRDDAFVKGAGTVEQLDVTPDYLSRITSDIEMKVPFKVVADCGNGVAGAVVPKLLSDIGCDLIPLYCEVDGNFPNHHPDPGQPENLVDLIAKVKETGADLGLAFDGDGDRLGVVTAEGKVIWPDRLMMLFAKEVASRHPGKPIIFDVKCSRFLPLAIAEAGGVPLMWKTGHSLIKAKIKETGAVLAGEMSGHIFFADRWYGFDDGVYSACRLLELLSRETVSPTEVFNRLPDSVNTPELQVQVEEGQQHRIIERLQKAMKIPGAVIHTLDGVRAEFEDGWGLARASNTTPVIVLRFEADDEAGLERIQNSFRESLLQVAPGLKLPF